MSETSGNGSDILCVLSSNEWDRSAEGLVGAGRLLSDKTGGKLIAVTLGEWQDSALKQLGARCHQVRVGQTQVSVSGGIESMLDYLVKIAEEIQPASILFGNGTMGEEISPRLAFRLGGSSIGDAQALTISNNRIQVTRSVYGGKATAVMELQKSPAVVWIRSRAFPPAGPLPQSGSFETTVIQETSPESIELLQHHEDASEGVSLEEATMIVSGGRGLGGPEPFEDLKALAATIGAEMAASRAACDAGWVPHSWQVGQTGKKVTPELYLAVAMSGSSQHMMGLTDARNIAAVNTDPDAPIFKHCRFGIVEDYRNVIGPLTEKLKSRKK